MSKSQWSDPYFQAFVTYLNNVKVYNVHRPRVQALGKSARGGGGILMHTVLSSHDTDARPGSGVLGCV